MTACYHQIVDSLSETPEVEFDLDEHFDVLSVSLTPPSLNASRIASNLRDGMIETGSVRDDRELVIVLQNIRRSTAGKQVESLQRLLRLLDAQAGQWFRHQPKGHAEPTFYRLKRGDVEVEDEILDDTPERTITLKIPAHPFGYGLPVSGTFSIGADPTSGGISYVWPDEVQGDVPAPLQLSLPMPSDSWGTNTIVTSSTSMAECVGLPLASFLPNSDVSGIVSDPTLPGGQSGKIIENNSFLACPVGDIAPGLYRVMARLRNNDAATAVPIAVWPGEYNGFDAPAILTKVSLDGDGDGDGANDDVVGWRDLGMAHFPSHPAPSPGSMQWVPDDYRDGPAPSITIGFDPILDGGADLYAIDVTFSAVALLPVSLIDAPTSSTYLGVKVARAYDEGTLWIDGETRFAAASDGSAEQPIPFGLGWPQVVPGQPNMLHVLTDLPADFGPVPVTFRYFPRYLYARPALS